MKVFQILNDICHWDATSTHPTLEDTFGLYAPDIVFIEAPDHVFEGWGCVNGEFIKPVPPEGWVYDPETGTLYPEGGAPAPEDYALTSEEIKAAIVEGVNSLDA